MSRFGNLKKDGLEEAQDRVGGFAAIETDIYLATIKNAYAGQSAGGAQSVTLLCDINGKEYKETIYVTNRKGENFFLNKDDKTKKVGLPGFTVMDHICIVTTDKDLSEQPDEEKMVNVWDNDAKKEMPKAVPVLVDLVGTQVYLGIVKQLENQSDKVGNDYVPNSKTRETNVIEKVFHYPSKMTVVEAGMDNPEAKFFDTWQERNKGQTRDRTTVKDGGTPGRPGQAGAPSSGDSSAPKGKSLFGKTA